jgi:hypothetical protein
VLAFESKHADGTSSFARSLAEEQQVRTTSLAGGKKSLVCDVPKLTV